MIKREMRKHLSPFLIIKRQGLFKEKYPKAFIGDIMFVIWKGRGLLTGFYLAISIIVMAFLSVHLEEQFGGVFTSDNTMLFAMALAFILAGLMTYYTSITHVKKDGMKVRVKSHHSLFFIPMYAWSIIMYTLGGVIFVAAIFSLHSRHVF